MHMHGYTLYPVTVVWLVVNSHGWFPLRLVTHTHNPPLSRYPPGRARWISSGYRGDSVCVGESSLVCKGALVTYTGLGPRGPIQCMCVRASPSSDKPRKGDPEWWRREMIRGLVGDGKCMAGSDSKA